MFRTLPNGVEIYFSWPSRTARVVPNKFIRNGIMMRDNALFALVALMGLSTAILREPSPAIGVAMGLLGLAGFVERSRYLSKLTKVSLELTSTIPDERSTGQTKRTGSIRSVQITSAEIDKAYIADRSPFDGVLLVAFGAPATALMSYLAFVDTEVPLVLSLPLTACALIITYVGSCILIGKMMRQRDKRHSSEKTQSSSAAHPEPLKRRTLWHPSSRRPGGRER